MAQIRFQPQEPSGGAVEVAPTANHSRTEFEGPRYQRSLARRSSEAPTEVRAARIPRPVGEVGRRTERGFSLKEELSWGDSELYRNVQVSSSCLSPNVFTDLASLHIQSYLKSLADIHLRVDRSITHQNAKDVAAVCSMVPFSIRSMSLHV